jgi:hypothetical protein
MVIFSDMKGGDHLSDDEAQLTEAELIFHKNVSIYNFDFEQSAITTPYGKVLNYEVGDDESVSYFSDDTKMKLGKKQYNKMLKYSINIHSHPSHLHFLNENRIPISMLSHINRLSETPSANDYLCLLHYCPVQQVTITPTVVTVLQPPLGSAHMRLKDRYYNVGKVIHYNHESVYGNKQHYAIDKSFCGYVQSQCNNEICGSFEEVINTYKLNKNKFVEFVNVLYNWQTMLFCLESSYYDIPVRFVRDIDLKTGIGKISGFSKDTMRMIKETHPINKIRSHGGSRIWDSDDNLILPEWY